VAHAVAHEHLGELDADRFGVEDRYSYLGFDFFAADRTGKTRPPSGITTSAPSALSSLASWITLRELLPKADSWNVMPPEQTTQKICERVLEFCRR
jgi:hypothetical protein